MARSFSENNFTDSVREYLRCKHGVEYNGRFYYNTPFDEGDVTSDDNVPAYRLQWLENNQQEPYIMAAEADSEEDFLQYVCKQITAQRFFLKKVFTLKRTDDHGRL